MVNKVFRNSPGVGGVLSKNDQEKVAQTMSQKASKDLLFLARNLVAPVGNQQQTRTTKEGMPIPEDADISNMFKTASTSVRDARNILRSSPELCMGIDIYIAGLLSPNDVTAPSLNITSLNSIELDPIKSQLLDVVRKWAKNEYDIDSKLKSWVFKSKFLAGAVPLAIVPLTEIDDIINENNNDKKKLRLESYDSSDSSVFSHGHYNSTGLLGRGLNQAGLGKNKSVSSILKLNMESGDAYSTSTITNRVVLSDQQKSSMQKSNNSIVTAALDNIYIHDNIEAFKTPFILMAAAKRSISKKFSPLYNMAMESSEGKKPNGSHNKQLDVGDGKLVYPNRQFGLNEVVNIRPRDLYDNFGHPLILELPYDSCFPVSPPGLSDKHVGYIVALDSTGNPLTSPEEELGVAGAGDVGVQTSSGILGTQMLSQMGDASVDGMSNIRHNATAGSAKLFTSILEADLKERLKNGIYSGLELDVKLTSIFAEMMWHRSLAGQQTQFLFIPTELLTYIAFEYNEFGMGESKLIKHRQLAVIASTIQIANALTAINNSIQHKKITIEFDEDEPDAFDTDEKIKQHVVSSQYAGRLFSSSNSQDQLNHILNAGYHFAYENGNGNFPGTRFDIEYLTREASQIDNEYLDSINRRLIMLSGVSPEIVDMSQEVEFAQTYITGHTLRAQQAAVEQQVLCTNLTKFIRSFVMHSKILIDEMVELVKKARDSANSPLKGSKTTDVDMIIEFIESIETSLPKPDTTKLKSQMENITEHEGFVDKLIEYHFNDPMFSSDEVGEKVGEKLDLIKAAWKTSYIRNVMQSNNLIPDHFKFLYGESSDEDNFDPFVESEEIVKRVVEYAIQHEAQMAKIKYKADVTIDNINEKEQTNAGDSEGASDSNDTPADDADDTTETPAADGDDSAATPADGDDAKADDDGGEDLFGGGDANGGGDFGFESADSPVIRGKRYHPKK